MEDDCTMYTIHLVCRVAAKKHEAPDDRSTEGPLRTEEEEEVVVMPTGQDQVQDWMRYINGLTINNNDSSQLSEENLQQVKIAICISRIAEPEPPFFYKKLLRL